jgi:hypothetical protein
MGTVMSRLSRWRRVVQKAELNGNVDSENNRGGSSLTLSWLHVKVDVGDVQHQAATLWIRFTYFACATASRWPTCWRHIA